MTYPNSNLSSPNQGSSTQFGNDVNGVASVPQGQQKSKVVAAVLAFFWASLELIISILDIPAPPAPSSQFA